MNLFYNTLLDAGIILKKFRIGNVMKDLERVEALLINIYEILNNQKHEKQAMKRALTTKEVKERFKIGSDGTVLELFRLKGSPAYRIGKDWRVDEDDFKTFLIQLSEQYKG